MAGLASLALIEFLKMRLPISQEYSLSSRCEQRFGIMARPLALLSLDRGVIGFSLSQKYGEQQKQQVGFYAAKQAKAIGFEGF